MDDIIERIDALLANTPPREVEEFEVTRCLRDAKDELIAASTLTGVMLQGTGQRMAESIAERVMGGMTVGAWIPVSERLPEVEQNVLAAVAGEVGIAHRYVDGWFWDVNEWSRPFTPSHWMPLPEPPEVT